ncbi:MAG: prepilin-type N-terminal cleavage/methylation domain-containing protein [Rubrivivax sp.]|nr:prepilin-type N-terminal cleavage/methylation domain-containing protein [Rubrivivax sp.]
MRLLSNPMARPDPGCRAAGRERGMTLVELMVGLAIAAILVMAAAPTFSDYIANSRLREAGNLLYSQSLLAQSEAIKRNTVVRLAASGSSLQIIDRTDPDAPVVLFTRTLTDGASAGVVSVDFTGEGRTVNFAEASIDISSSNFTCSTEIRCPGLRVDGGGGIRLCNDHTGTC